MRIYIIIAIVSASVGAGLVYWLYPRTVTEVQTKETIKKDVVTVVHEVVRKDGTIDRTTEITDHTKETSRTSSTQTIAPKIPVWALRGEAYAETGRGPGWYTVGLERRLIGPFWAGIQATTKHDYGFTIRMEF